MSIGNAGSNTTTASNAEVSNLLVQGFKAAKEGRREEAYDIFCDVVRRDPNNELGWLYRAATTQDLSEAYVCLQRVLNINPANEKAQRGVERIQNRLSAETSSRTAAANGGSTAAAVPPPIEEREVISGFNPNFGRQSAPAPAPVVPQVPNPAPRYPYQAAPSPFNQVQPAQAEGNAAPPPYRPDFGQLNQPGPINRPPTSPNLAARPAPPAYVPTFAPAPASEDTVEDDEDMVDEPVASGPAGSQRETTKAPRRALVGGLAAARQRGRATFGSNTPTDLDQNGQRRSRQILIPLVILGIVLVIAALLILLLPIFKGNSNPTATSVAVVSTTTSATGANPPVSTATPGGRPATAAAVTVPVVGATTAAPATTAVSTVADTTVAPATTIAANTAAPVTTAAPATTAAAPATQAPPPPATTAPAAPVLPRATVYIIKGGDNLTRIATQYSTSIAAIQAANTGLQANSIYSGNRIVVPVSRPDFRGKGAIIGANETLQTIADRYKVSVDDLARFNGYNSPADAKPGDAVLVP